MRYSGFEYGVGVKRSNEGWPWAVVITFLLLVFAGLLLSGRSPVMSAAGSGIVQVAFKATLTSFDGAPIADRYQRVLLNVISIRLNPTPGATDATPGWVEIPAPADSGVINPTQFITTSQNYGGIGTLLSLPSSILQLDLMPLQNIPFFFNAGTVPAQPYGQLEVVLDTIAPGNLVPLCHSGPGEGCISYLANLTPQSSLSVPFSTTGFGVPAGAVRPLLINVAVTVGAPPSSPTTGAVAITPVISAQGNLLPSTTPSPLGVVTGAVANANPNTMVTAELTGTDQVVASTHLSNGAFILNLPALTEQEGGTSYDFYVSGGDATYAVSNAQSVSIQGTSTTPPPPVNLDFTLQGSPVGTLTGTIADACSGEPIQGATLRLLVPDTSKGSATSCDLSGESPSIPANCVVVATASTDDGGHYPLPNTPFTNVPLFPPPGVTHYDLEISAPGYNTMVVPIAPGSLFCPNSRFANSCSFYLEHGFITGTTELSGLNDTGNRLDALVMAEDAGTNNIENLTLSTIPGGAASGLFTLSVPIANPSANAIPVSNFDVFASIQDLYQGAPEKVSGHLIGVAASVGAPATNCGTIAIPALSPMECVGLGSVFGTVTDPNPGTTSIRLSKNGVQIMQTEPNSLGPASGSMYNFCAPADTYLLTRLENGVARSSSPVTLLPPPPNPSTCPSICQSVERACLICQSTEGPSLP
jgi:hypothetical protein